MHELHRRNLSYLVSEKKVIPELKNDLTTRMKTISRNPTETIRNPPAFNLANTVSYKCSLKNSIPPTRFPHTNVEPKPRSNHTIDVHRERFDADF